jgi:DNA invertase Pin-like site-specific DNA recombinase
MLTAIYTRVSSSTQDTRSQDADLEAYGTQLATQGEEVAFYRDSATGTDFNRPGWLSLEADIHAGKVNRLVVWRLDRLGRTAGQVIRLLDDLEARGVQFISLRDGFDPSTPAGRLQRNILAAVAQFETEVRSERQRAGIAAARAAGKRWGGRRPGTRITLTLEKEAAIKQLKEKGYGVTMIATALGLSRKSVYRALRESKLSPAAAS